MTDEAAVARADWQRRIGRRSDLRDPVGATADGPLPPPAQLRVEGGAGQVTVVWEPVPGAVGYLVHRADAGSDHFRAIDHRGGDVLAVPGPRYADTTVEPGRRYRYAVAALPDLERGPGAVSDPVEAGPTRASSGSAEPPAVDLTVRADAPGPRLQRLWRMIGSERLSQLRTEARSGGRPVAAEFADALRLAREQLGAESVRAHAVFHDDLGVYRDTDEGPRYDFSAVDEVYDQLLDLGLRPVVELSFMPRDLASDPTVTVFGYGAIVSPPRDWDRWGELNARMAAHLVERYGLDEVASWGFEVWNEANLEVFWSGSQSEYFRLYEVAARAIKSVDERLLVGGPSSAAAGWINDFLDFVEAEAVPLDFVSTHTYGNVPLDVREALRRRGLERVQVWWTEWGVSPTHFLAVNDGAFGAPFVLHGMKAAQRSADALAYWVVSDHFEELGRPPRLLHGGFGLLTVGNLPKPRFWALRLAQELDDQLCEVLLDGDGAGSLVDAWASAAPDGRVDVLAWNGTLDQSKADGEASLARLLRVRVEGLPAARYTAAVTRVDRDHGDLSTSEVGGQEWPDDAGWERLRRDAELREEPLGEMSPDGGALTFSLHLPMPGVVRLRLTAG